MGLLYAWFRRKQWEAQVNAKPFLRALTELLQAFVGETSKPMGLGSLAMLGFKVVDKRR